MPTAYKGTTIPLPTDLADGPKALQDFVDSLPASDLIAATSIPPGTIIVPCRTTGTVDWLLLDGSTVTGAQTTYPKLWAIVPAGWRSGADLILPDCRGRLLIGLDPANTAIDALADKSGAATAALAEANLPPHAHAELGTIATTNESAQHNHGAAGGGQFVETFFGSSLQLPGGSGARGGSLTGANVQSHNHSVTLSGNTGAGLGTAAP